MNPAQHLLLFALRLYRWCVSPVLTLQGAVAHVDMPVESGPTLYLPYSQTFEPGYFAWRKPEFVADVAQAVPVVTLPPVELQHSGL